MERFRDSNFRSGSFLTRKLPNNRRASSALMLIRRPRQDANGIDVSLTMTAEQGYCLEPCLGLVQPTEWLRTSDWSDIVRKGWLA